MKKKIGIAILLVLAGYAIHAQQSHRFERIVSDDQGRYSSFVVWHDKESGQEFTCVYSGVDLGLAVSCFPTGRNWK